MPASDEATSQVDAKCSPEALLKSLHTSFCSLQKPPGTVVDQTILMLMLQLMLLLKSNFLTVSISILCNEPWTARSFAKVEAVNVNKQAATQGWVVSPLP